MTITLYAESIEELIDLKIEQRIFGQHDNVIIKLKNEVKRI